jgi:hypothetical protein
MTHSIRSGVTIQTTPTSRAGSYGGWKKAVNIAFPRPRAGKAPHSDIVGAMSANLTLPTRLADISILSVEFSLGESTREPSRLRSANSGRSGSA